MSFFPRDPDAQVDVDKLNFVQILMQTSFINLYYFIITAMLLYFVSYILTCCGYLKLIAFRFSVFHRDIFNVMTN